MQERFVGFETGVPDSPDVVAVRSDKITRIQQAGVVYNQEPKTSVYYTEGGEPVAPLIVNQKIDRVLERVNAALMGLPEPKAGQVAIGRRQPA